MAAGLLRNGPLGVTQRLDQRERQARSAAGPYSSARGTSCFLSMASQPIVAWRVHTRKVVARIPGDVNGANSCPASHQRLPRLLISSHAQTGTYSGSCSAISCPKQLSAALSHGAVPPPEYSASACSIMPFWNGVAWLSAHSPPCILDYSRLTVRTRCGRPIPLWSAETAGKRWSPHLQRRRARTVAGASEPA
jgi:hypothetical protein